MKKKFPGNKFLLGSMALALASPTFAWTPNDPFFPTQMVIGPVLSPSPIHQWGMHTMNFPLAWDVTQGNAYIGVIEWAVPYDGDKTNHPDLKKNYRWHFIGEHNGSVDKDGSTNLFPNETSADYTPRPYSEFNAARAHSSHVSGIIAATANNSIGVTGGCPDCSFAIWMHQGESDKANNLSTDWVLKAIVESGVQIINWSGATISSAGGSSYLGKGNCEIKEVSIKKEGGDQISKTKNKEICDVMKTATDFDVLVIQSAGNYSQTSPDFPGNLDFLYTVLPVGGIDRELVNSSTQLWKFNINEHNSRVGSSAVGLNGVVAPARNILSTVVSGTGYEDHWSKCGDTLKSDLSRKTGDKDDGYGTCTGTSMAAPHVTALAGLVWSINPRLSAVQVRDIIKQSGHLASSPSPDLGWGLPDAKKAVDAALATNPNRLTPLFALYSEKIGDHFYTTVPQMARAAIKGTLHPKLKGTGHYYVPSGDAAINDYPNFPGVTSSSSSITISPAPGPGPDLTPTADAWIFTTSKNPKNPQVPLVPLYRLSWRCADWKSTDPLVNACVSNPEHIDITYTADPVNGVKKFEELGYKLDGIEGYIYPMTIPQPAGTVRLMRKYNPIRDDHAIFPETKLQYFFFLGNK